MDEYLKKLNLKQLDACVDVNGPSLIVAGAGSGKTRVLTSRIAYLINNCGISPSEILAITFTNKAAKEMNDRLYDLVGSNAKFLTCKTFHSFSSVVLRNEIEIFPNRKKSFQIIDDDETEALIKKVMVEFNYDIKTLKPKSIADDISLIKARIKSLDDFRSYTREKLEFIIDAYNKELIKNNLLDFDDLLLITVTIFENFPEILNKYQERYKYILVDEFQDSSNIQYELIKLLGEKYKNVFIVGDEDQSIYSFRGANIGNIRKFMDDFKGYHKYVLDQNYRSTKGILDCANKLIAHNEDRIKKDLWTENVKEDSKVILNMFDSDKAECRYISSIIRREVGSGKYNYSDYAILYRNNFLSRNFENELIANHIPYRVYSGLSFYKRKEVKDMLGYLRLVLDPNDFYSFKRIVNSPRRGIGDTILGKIEAEFDKLDDKNIEKAIANASIYQSTRETLKKLFDNIKELRNSFEGKTLKEFFLLVYEKCEYKKYIDEIEDDDERESRKDNIKELLSAISEIETEGSIEETLSDFLENVSLLSELDIEAADMNHVSLITMHSAKGLEYKNVFAVGLEDDIIPGQRMVLPKELEEERRILYVCLTRAMENLYISCATSRYKYSQMNTTFPSRFLKETGLTPENEKDKNRTFVSQKIQRNVVVGEFKTGDRVFHEIYKEGSVLGQAEGFYIIKFDNVPAPKKVIVNHPFLKKI